MGTESTVPKTYDKVVDSSELEAGLTLIADAIREKGGTSDTLAFPDAMAEAIAAIEAGNYEATGDFELSGSLSGTFTVSNDSDEFVIALSGGIVPKIVLYYTQDDASQVSSKAGVVATVVAHYSPTPYATDEQDSFYIQSYAFVYSGKTTLNCRTDILRTNSVGINQSYAGIKYSSIYNAVRQNSTGGRLTIGGNIPYNMTSSAKNLFAAGCTYRYYVFYSEVGAD